MKTIYNIKALCVMALLGASQTVSAQEDKTKEKPELGNDARTRI